MWRLTSPNLGLDERDIDELDVDQRLPVGCHWLGDLLRHEHFGWPELNKHNCAHNLIMRDRLPQLALTPEPESLGPDRADGLRLTVAAPAS